MIDVSGASIKNKYHNAKFVIKGNEVPSTPITKPATVLYDYTTSPITKTTLTTTVREDVRSVITGRQGYAIKTIIGDDDTEDGTLYFTYANNSAWDDLQEWTFVCHLTPTAADASRDAYFLSHGTDIEMYIEGSD